MILEFELGPVKKLLKSLPIYCVNYESTHSGFYLPHVIHTFPVCQTPDQRGNVVTGTCELFPQCQQLFQSYQTNPNNRQLINQLTQAQRNCGNQNYNRTPIICCATNGQAPITQAPPVTPPVNTRGGCTDPNGAQGVCQSESTIVISLRAN